MNSFFIILFFLSSIGLLVGLIKPSLIRFKSRKMALAILVPVMLLSFFATTYTSGKKNEISSPKQEVSMNLTPEEKIKGAVSKVKLVKLSFDSIDREVNESNGIQAVTVNIKVENSYSKEQFFKRSGELSGEIFKSIFPESEKIAVVTIKYRGDMVDEFGTVTPNGNFVVETLSRPTYDRIVWENFDTTKICDFLRKNNTNDKGDIINSCFVYVDNLK